MANIVVNNTLPDSSVKQDFYNLISGATVEDIVAADLSSGSVDGAAATPSLRTLGIGALQAASGNDARLSDDRTASGLRTASGIVSISSSEAPIAGMALIAQSTNSAKWDTPSANAVISVLGSTVSTKTDGEDLFKVVGVSTSFLSQLKTGFQIKIGTDPSAETHYISSIESDTVCHTSVAWSGAFSAAAWAYIVIANPRPFDRVLSRTADYTIKPEEAGVIFEVQTTGGDVILTLPPVADFLAGNTITIKKVSDDTYKAAFIPDTTDTIDGLNYDATDVGNGIGYFITQSNGVLTLISDGDNGRWRIAFSLNRQGSVMQSKRVSSSAKVTLPNSAKMPVRGDATLAPAITDGTEIITTGSLLKFTPQSATSIIRVHGVLIGGCSDALKLCVAAFNVTGLLGASINSFDTGIANLEFDFTVANWGTTEVDVKLRAGPSANSFYLNANGSNAALLGAATQSFVEIQEIAI